MSMGTTAVMAMHLYEQGCCFKNSLGSSVIPYCLCWDHGKSYTLVGASTPTVLQYAQEVKSNGFHEYDWGEREQHLFHHGPNRKPTYRLQDVTTPVDIYYNGQNDWLASSTDVLRTISELPSIVPGMLH